MKFTVRPHPPYNLQLTLRILGQLTGEAVDRVVDGAFHRFFEVNGQPVFAMVKQEGSYDTPVLHIELGGINSAFESVKESICWMLRCDQGLNSFYEATYQDPIIMTIAESLQGLKPFCTPTVFEAAVIAITEQQYNYLRAVALRGGLSKKFGSSLEYEGQKYYTFPSPESLAAASPEEIRELGLSWRKADYIINLAQNVASGQLDLETLKRASNEEALDLLMSIRGLGLWSSEYIMARGLGRMDIVPSGDVALRNVVSQFYFKGKVITFEETKAFFDRWGPYKRYVSYYLTCASRFITEVQRSQA